MPKDITREFLTRPRKFDEIMEKLEIIINEMMAEDGPAPNGPYEDVCVIAWKEDKAGKGTGKKGSNGPGVWHRGQGADE